MRSLFPLALLPVLTFITAAPAQEAEPDSKPAFAGPSDQGFLLPNGWRLTPAGKQVVLTDLPLNILADADGKHAIVATGGYNAHELTAIELATGEKVASQTAQHTWFGLAMENSSGRLWWSGGGSAVLHNYTWKDSKLAFDSDYPPALQPGDTAPPDSPPTGFRTGVFLDQETGVLYSLTILPKGDAKSFAWGDATTDSGLGGAITRMATHAGHDTEKTESKTVSQKCGNRPYDVIKAGNGLLYVSDWADRRVLVVEPQSLRTVARISVGEHPNQLALHPKDNRLFVACASSNAVYVIDTNAGTVQETIYTPLFPQSPEGSTPDALCISPDGETLFVANADNNCIAVVDIEHPRKSAVKGFIPTGWYPTALAITPDGEQLLVGVGKGNQTAPNKPAEATLDAASATGPLRGDTHYFPFPYIGTTLSGALSIVEVPDAKQLAAYTDQVYRNCPYSDKLLTAVPSSRKTAIPTEVGGKSPIKHVIYIIKENRTYDQVFSDLPRGNGDPSLLLFGAEVTPNHHKLASEFVLLDNLYCNGHVSADGHPWSTMAYNTDYIARNWALTYSGREGIDDDDEGALTNAPSGYIWDSCKRHGITYRSYGEYGGRIKQKDGTFRIVVSLPQWLFLNLL